MLLRRMNAAQPSRSVLSSPRTRPASRTRARASAPRASRRPAGAPWRAISALMRRTTGSGVPAGATTPNEVNTSTGKPAWASVGTPGSSGVDWVTASARSLPARMWAMAEATSGNMNCTWPPKQVPVACADALVRHMRVPRAGLLLEHAHAKVHGPAGSQLYAIFPPVFCRRHHLGNRIRLQARRSNDDHRRHHAARHRREIALRRCKAGRGRGWD